MNITKKITVYILTILLFTSCSSRQSVILADQDCLAPCWRGISMGVEKEKIIPLLHKMGDIALNSIEINPNQGFSEEAISWKFKNRPEEWGSIFLHDQKAVMIAFTNSRPLPLIDFIDKFGEPQNVYITKDRLDGVMIVTRIVFLDKGICLMSIATSLSGDFQEYPVKPSTRIDEVYFFDSSILTQQPSVGCVAGIDMTQLSNNTIEWNGYSDYPIYSPKTSQ